MASERDPLKGLKDTQIERQQESPLPKMEKHQLSYHRFLPGPHAKTGDLTVR